MTNERIPVKQFIRPWLEAQLVAHTAGTMRLLVMRHYWLLNRIRLLAIGLWLLVQLISLCVILDPDLIVKQMTTMLHLVQH